MPLSAGRRNPRGQPGQTVTVREGLGSVIWDGHPPPPCKQRQNVRPPTPHGTVGLTGRVTVPIPSFTRRQILQTEEPKAPVLTDRVLSEVLEMSTRINNSAFLLGAEAARLGQGFIIGKDVVLTCARVVKPYREAEGASTLDTLIGRSRESLIDVHRILLGLGNVNGGGAIRAPRPSAARTFDAFPGTNFATCRQRPSTSTNRNRALHGGRGCPA